MPIDCSKPNFFSVEQVAHEAGVPVRAMRAHIHRTRVSPDGWLFENSICRALFTDASVRRILKARKASWLGDEAEVKAWVEDQSAA
jgi:hypothetical protein